MEATHEHILLMPTTNICHNAMYTMLILPHHTKWCLGGQVWMNSLTQYYKGFVPKNGKELKNRIKTLPVFRPECSGHLQGKHGS